MVRFCQNLCKLWLNGLQCQLRTQTMPWVTINSKNNCYSYIYPGVKSFPICDPIQQISLPLIGWWGSDDFLLFLLYLVNKRLNVFRCSYDMIKSNARGGSRRLRIISLIDISCSVSFSNKTLIIPDIFACKEVKLKNMSQLGANSPLDGYAKCCPRDAKCTNYRCCAKQLFVKHTQNLLKIFIPTSLSK